MHAALRWGYMQRFGRALVVGLAAGLLLVGGITSAQEGSGGGGGSDDVEAVVLREPGPDAVASHARLILEPETGAPVVIWREAGSRFGRDRVVVEVFEDGDWQRLPLNGLLDDTTNIITPDGIALAFDERGTLFAAINREFPDDGPGVARTLVTRFGGGGWEQLGEPVGELPTVGPVYLFEAEFGLTLATIEEGEDADELRVRFFDGDEWSPLGDPVLNLDPESDAQTLYAVADNAGRPLMVWSEESDAFGTTLPFVNYWDGSDWDFVFDLPQLEAIEIGDVMLSGLATGAEGFVHLLTVERFEDTSFADMWLQDTSFVLDWDDLSLPRDAENSECATAQAIASGPDDFAYYAWLEPCENVLRLARVDSLSGQWLTFDAEIPTGRIPNRVQPLQLAIDPRGIAYVLWLESDGTRNGPLGVAAFTLP